MDEAESSLPPFTTPRVQLSIYLKTESFISASRVCLSFSVQLAGRTRDGNRGMSDLEVIEGRSSFHRTPEKRRALRRETTSSRSVTQLNLACGGGMLLCFKRGLAASAAQALLLSAAVVKWTGTGATTLVAARFDGGVVIGADSRTSQGNFVANRLTDKITPVAPSIFLARSGSSAGT